MRRAFWLSITCSAALLMSAAPSWMSKEAAKWTVEDARQVLRDSPWAKRSAVTILPQRSEAAVREGGGMGGGKGSGLGALGPSVLTGLGDNGRQSGRRFAPKQQTLLVRWESGPVRLAEEKTADPDAPEWKGDYYAIAVYGVPGLEDQSTLPLELKKKAFLRRHGKKDERPEHVDVVRIDDNLATVVFLFPRSQAIADGERDIWFVAQMGQLFVEQSFDTREMKFQGKLDL